MSFLQESVSLLLINHHTKFQANLTRICMYVHIFVEVGILSTDNFRTAGAHWVEVAQAASSPLVAFQFLHICDMEQRIDQCFQLISWESFCHWLPLAFAADPQIFVLAALRDYPPLQLHVALRLVLITITAPIVKPLLRRDMFLRFVLRIWSILCQTVRQKLQRSHKKLSSWAWRASTSSSSAPAVH